MKALKITQELKDTNIELFGGIEIGFIRPFQTIPHSFYSLNYNQNQRTDGYNLLEEEIHIQDGFLDLITPEINDNEKLGEIIFDTDKFIYEVLELPEPTQEEIQNLEFQQYLKRKYDGEQAYLKLSAEFRLAKLSGIITEEAHSAIEEILTPVRNEVMFGQWKKGLSILELIGSNQIGISLYDRLHLQISNYISENY